FMLEQTFYVPVAALQYPERSPLRVLEKLAGRALVG
ncbi:MAG: Kdo hydroxylase family protein, partial [Solimonas sp.]